MQNWWIPEQKHYQIQTKTWWCRHCLKRAPLERNPNWDGSFKGTGPALEWFVRCGICQYKHYQLSGYECPNCGWDDISEETMISSTEPIYSVWKAMEFGGHPIDWEETHRCRKCRTVFTFSNSNC